MPSESHTAFDSDSDSYQSEPNLHTTPSSPMDGAKSDPFSGMIIGSGPMSIPQVNTNTLASGPIATMQTVLTQLPPPVITNQATPTVILGGSGPSTHLEEISI